MAEKFPDHPNLQSLYNKIEGYTWEQWNYAHSVDQQTIEYLNEHQELDDREGADAVAPIIADKMHIPTVVVEEMQRFNEDVAAYKHVFKRTFGREPEQRNGEIGPTTSQETKPFAGIPVTEYETMWMKEKDPTYVPPQIENRYLDESVSTANLSPGYYHTEVNRMGMPTVYGKAKINDQEMDVYFEQRYKTHMLTDPEIHSLLLGQTISVPEETGSIDVKLTEHEQYKGLWMVMPAEPEKTAKTQQAQTASPSQPSQPPVIQQPMTEIPQRNDPNLTNEQVLQMPRADYAEPYQWKYTRVLDHRDQHPNLGKALKMMVDTLMSHAEYRNNAFAWDVNPLYHFSEANPNNPKGSMADHLKNLPKDLSPNGFQREDLPGNQFKVSAECSHDIIERTYTYSPEEIAQHGKPTDVQLAGRLMEDYMTDRTLDIYKQFQNDLEVSQKLRNQFAANNWQPVTATNNGHAITISPQHYTRRSRITEQLVDYFMVDSPEAEIYGDRHLINVANTLNHLPEIVKQSDKSKQSLNEFFNREIAGHTEEQFALARAVTDRVITSCIQHRDIPYEEHLTAVFPLIANELHTPTKVVEAAYDFGEKLGNYNQSYGDLYGHRPDENATAYAVSLTETKPFAGIKFADYESEWRKENHSDLTRPSEVRTPSTDGFMHHTQDGWKPLKASTIEDDGFKVEFSRYAERTIDPMCDALNGWHYAWQNDFECKYTDKNGELTLRTQKPEEADRLFDIMTNVQPVTFEHEGTMAAAEVARAGMQALIQFIHPEEAKTAQPAPQKPAPQTQTQEQPAEKKDFSQLKPGEYEIIQDKKGTPYIHGKPDYKGAPAEAYFKQTYGTHELTDMETKTLLKGNEISIPVRSGQAQVKLGEGQINGHPYFGLQRTDIPEKTRRLPDAPEASTSTTDKQVGSN